MNRNIINCLRRSLATAAIILGMSCMANNAYAQIMSDDNSDAYTSQTIDGKNYLLNTQTKEAQIQKGEYDTEGEFVIPETVTYGGEEYTVTSIGEKCFYNCNSITNIVIPETIKEIGEAAFFYCTGLRSIDIPLGATIIPNLNISYSV